MNKIFITLFLILSADTSYSLDHFSVTSREMNTYVRSCVRTPSVSDMKKEIDAMVMERRHAPKSLTWLDRFLSLFGQSVPTQVNLPQVQIDKMEFENLNTFDLDVFSRLTLHRDAFRPYFRDSYDIQNERIGEKLQITRICNTYTCKDRKVNRPRNLQRYDKKPPCQDVMCGAERVFGKDKAPYILWAYLKYGINLSQYADINGDVDGFNIKNLQSIIAAVESVPPHLRKDAVEDTTFYRFQRGMTLAMYGDGNGVVANAAGSVFDSIDDYNSNEQVFIFTHELGHRTNRYNDQDLDESEDWLMATGWRKKADGDFVNNSRSGWVSLYAKENPAEDFAESYTMYRFNPKKLKTVSPARYEFMRNKVFEGIEYDVDLCHGRRGSGANQNPSSKSSK